MKKIIVFWFSFVVQLVILPEFFLVFMNVFQVIMSLLSHVITFAIRTNLIPSYSLILWHSQRCLTCRQAMLGTCLTEVAKLATPSHHQWVWWHFTCQNSLGCRSAYMSDLLICQSHQFSFFPNFFLTFSYFPFILCDSIVWINPHLFLVWDYYDLFPLLNFTFPAS